MEMFKKLTTTNSLVVIIAVLLILFVIDQYRNKDFFGLAKKQDTPNTKTP